MRRHNKNIIELRKESDCEKIPYEICTYKNHQGFCKQVKNGFTKACIYNSAYKYQKILEEDVFKNPEKLTIEELDDFIDNKNKDCGTLSKQDCQDVKGLKMNCVYEKNYFFTSKCILDPKVRKYYYPMEGKCMKEGCNKHSILDLYLCEEHYKNLNELVKSLESLEQDIYKGSTRYIQNTIEMEERFKSIILYLETNYRNLLNTDKYLSLKKYIKDVTQEYNLKFGKNEQCQAVNITECKGRGVLNKFCTNSGSYNDDNGFFCSIHRKCYKDYKKKFENYNNNYLEICKKGDKFCINSLNEMKSFYKMISLTDEGNAYHIKNEVKKLIDIFNYFIQYYKKNKTIDITKEIKRENIKIKLEQDSII